MAHTIEVSAEGEPKFYFYERDDGETAFASASTITVTTLERPAPCTQELCGAWRDGACHYNR